MPTTYTITNVVVAPLLRDDEEGQLIQITFDIARNGTVVGSISQRYGVSVTNAEIRADLIQKIRQVVGADYDLQQQADLLARCAAIAANLADTSQTFP